MSSESATAALSQLELNECPFAKLADGDLAKIFKNLPPFERLIVSEICVKWRDISQAPWRDVTQLDLCHVPTQYVHAVIKKCPNLNSVSALRQNLGDLGRLALRLNNITAFKCVGCSFTTDLYAARSVDPSASLRSAYWQELIWHNSNVLADFPLSDYSLPCGYSQSLRRLQLTGLSVSGDEPINVTDSSNLPLMESVILANEFYDGACSLSYFHREDLAGAFMVKSLRELYLDSTDLPYLLQLLLNLPALKMLYLHKAKLGMNSFVRLIREHPGLCVLVITAVSICHVDREILIPVRKLFPNVNAPPVPPLHLFLGKIAAERLRFHPSQTDALKTYPIDAPLPEFLEKEEIKPIFEGSWIASRIREGFRDRTIGLADYSVEGNAESISYVE